ncbi:MAG TPA: organomercurial lyase [Candidatus Acidoferrum sp.]|nr:organomercurial lyase [Candidatus Acidoferrum sp.]
MEPISRESLDWSVRLFVYRHIVDHERPPTIAETADAIHLDPYEARLAFERLHERHALFLEPGSVSVRMAHPFSGVRTPFHVHTGGHSYWANCAWDALGIPAVLAADATIEATFSDDREAVRLSVKNQRVHGQEVLVHFALPFRRWYEDLILT